MGNKQLSKLDPFSVVLEGGDIETLKKIWPSEKWAVNITNDYGQSILHAAVSVDRSDVAQLALAYGVDTTIIDSMGLKASEYEGGGTGALLRIVLGNGKDSSVASEITQSLTGPDSEEDEEVGRGEENNEDFEVDSDFGEYVPSGGGLEEDQKEGEDFSSPTFDNLKMRKSEEEEVEEYDGEESLFTRFTRLSHVEETASVVSVRTSEATTIGW